MVPRFYVDAPLRAGSVCTLSEDAAHHAIHVLRLREGEPVTVFNGRGGEFSARIAFMKRLEVSIDILEHRAVERESPLHITLVQSVSAGEKMDSTVRKAVELGVTDVQPVLAARSVARPKGERAENRRAHWQKVVIAACEQCGRNRIPVVHPVMGAIEYPAAQDAAKLLLSPASQLRFARAAKAADTFVIAAGPEAGFTAEEEAALVSRGFVPVSLGPRILRTETAAVAALAALNALRGDCA